MLGTFPAYNMTYTSTRADENNPTMLKFMQIWTVKDDRAYLVGYAGTASQFNYSIEKAQKMIDSFEMLKTKGHPTVEAS
jgi:eukaryotic-like serine/threonine-protein kinase